MFFDGAPQSIESRGMLRAISRINDHGLDVLNHRQPTMYVCLDVVVEWIVEWKVSGSRRDDARIDIVRIGEVAQLLELVGTTDDLG